MGTINDNDRMSFLGHTSKEVEYLTISSLKLSERVPNTNFITSNDHYTFFFPQDFSGIALLVSHSAPLGGLSSR